MFNIFIQGLNDGEHKVDMQVPVEEVPEMFEEYFGEISLKGKLKKIGSRYTLFAVAQCNARMMCDISLEEFIETINVEVNLSFVAESKQTSDSRRQATVKKNEKQEPVGVELSADGKYADIAGDIREIFAVNLPMKRVAPEFRDKDFKEIFPEYTSEANNPKSDLVDERWAPLNKINSN